MTYEINFFAYVHLTKLFMQQKKELQEQLEQKNEFVKNLLESADGGAGSFAVQVRTKSVLSDMQLRRGTAQKCDHSDIHDLMTRDLIIEAFTSVFD